MCKISHAHIDICGSEITLALSFVIIAAKS